MERKKLGVRRGSAGFTLIELLVVVMIIGLLASMGIPQYYKVVERSRAAEANSFIGVLRAAEERYMTQNGSYAGTMDKLDLGFKCSGSVSNGDCGMKAFDMDTLHASASGCVNQPGWDVTLKRTTSRGVEVGTQYSGYTISYNRCSDSIVFSQTDLQ